MNDPLSLTVARFLFLLVCGVFAALTVVTHLAQFYGMSFQVYAWVCLCVAIIVCGWVVIVSRKQFQQATDGDRGALAGVVLLGMIGATLALASHRPDADDYCYLPNAVYCLENQKETMGFDVRALYSVDRPFRAYAWFTSLPFEYLQAVVAYHSRVPFLAIYYLVSPAISGFLIAFSLFYLVARFADTTRDAVLGTAVALGITMLLGETHRTFGNFSFVRIFQGKAVCMTIGIPVFAAATIDFFRRRQLRDWFLCAAVMVAMLGATSSTLVLFPALSMVLMISMMFALKDQRPSVPTLAAYAGAYGYLFLYTSVFYVLQERDGLLQKSLISPDFPMAFSEHFNFIFGGTPPVTAVVLVGTTLLSIVLLCGWRRRALLAWIGSAVVLYLNPFVGNALIRLAAPLRDVYWRLFYTYPFPLVAGITFSTVSRYLTRLPGKTRVAAWSGIFAVLIGCHFLPGSTSSLRAAHIGWPRYKLPPDALDSAKKIVSFAPRGPMLGPREISGVISVLTSGCPPVRNRNDGVERWLGVRGRALEARLRIEGSDFVEGAGGNLTSFENILDQLPLKSVVLKKSVFELEAVNHALAKREFTQRRYCEPYVVTWKK